VNHKLYWFIIPLILFLFFRIFVIGSEYYITGGSEFAMDKWNFTLGLKPLSVIAFETNTSDYSQPPLYPLAIAPLAIPLSKISNEFLAPRITYSILELLGFVLIGLFLFKSEKIKRLDRFYVLTIMAFSPLGFMTGAVMKQEEAIVMVLLRRFCWHAG